jgi:hypothetical protein
MLEAAGLGHFKWKGATAEAVRQALGINTQ